jgi:hypothetical protein
MTRTGRSDRFSLGAVAYELVTGRKAFAEENLASLLAMIVREDAPHLANPGLEAVLKKAMAKDAVGRFESCGEFVRALRGAA